ncbi:MAG TPA: S41 family peptidase [Acidimicrobiia bacterium]
MLGDLSHSAYHVAASAHSGSESGQSADQYLDTALNVVESEDVFSHNADWPSLRRRAHALLDGTPRPSIDDAQRAIEMVLAALGNDGHAHVISAATWAAMSAGETAPPESVALPSGWMLNRAVGYVNLPGFVPLPDTPAARRYATVGLDLVQRLTTQGARSWIVDLRTDSGGDMAPMLIAIAPILGDGRLIGFRPLHGPTDWYSYRDDALFEGHRVSMRAPKHVRLAAAAPRVAVLIGAETGSAGEAVAISFIGRPETRTFGLPTAGATSSPAYYALSDGAVLSFAAYSDVDRTGRTYLASIQPDHVVADINGNSALDAARQWAASVTP